jgi:fructose-bisphosphate aldolase class 1
MRSKRDEKPGLVSMGSAPLTSGSKNSSTTSHLSRFAYASMAARWRLSLSFSGATFAALEVRR